ncbi:pyridine nucleotide-disulfide oxidoreductase domain-containing protein 1 [Palaemon carinicauda]|uniref:pyridine nucleotide-disulfide oxidoreductase domain-containing protein 1 n=1 Tax=Palaemon carinicauda TaxID=392227 RepID=UPI0035B65E08
MNSSSEEHQIKVKKQKTYVEEHEDMEEYTYIVVGGGIAGVTCAEHLYILDPEAQTLLLTASYLIKAVTNVLPLTKTLDAFDVEEQPPDELVSRCPSVTVKRDAVLQLDAKNKVIHTTSGKKFKYEKLCICSGAHPKVIPVAGSSPYVLWIRDTESVGQFQARMADAKRIVIVGNGGIATEMVYEVTGIEVIWAIKDKYMTANFIDPGAAEFFRPELCREKVKKAVPLKRLKYTIDKANGDIPVMGGALGPDWHEKLELKGDNFHRVILEKEVEVACILSPEEVKKLGKTVTSTKFEEGSTEWPVYVELTNGKVYGCNFIVSATGVVPNSKDFLAGNNFSLSPEGGFLVDDKMQTTEKDVYAAGDVCTPNWELSPHWFQMRLWTQARQMGSYAAKCMWSSVSGEEMYMDFCFELFCHATKFFGKKVILLGLYNGQGLESKYEVLLRYSEGVEYIKCVMVDGRMQGALMIGETDLEETFENLILNQMDLSEFGEDLLNPDIDIEDYFD